MTYLEKNEKKDEKKPENDCSKSEETEKEAQKKKRKLDGILEEPKIDPNKRTAELLQKVKNLKIQLHKLDLNSLNSRNNLKSFIFN